MSSTCSGGNTTGAPSTTSANQGSTGSGGNTTGAPSATSASQGSTGSGGNTTGAPSATSASDRKSTRLNSSHLGISYAVFCLKKKRIGGKRTSSPNAAASNHD